MDTTYTNPLLDSSYIDYNNIVTEFETRLIELDNLVKDSQNYSDSIPSMEEHGQEAVMSIIKKVGAFLDSVAKTLNVVAMTLNKLLASGFPLFNSIIKKAIEIKERARAASEDKDLTVSGKFKSLKLGNSIASTETIVEQFEKLDHISKVLLDKGKLNQFENIASNTLEPFRGNIKSKKTDEVVFVLGVLACLTNPAVPVGLVLKKLAGALAPNTVGKVVDIAQIATGIGLSKAIIGGMAGVIPTMGAMGTSMVRDFQNGRLRLSTMPKYSEVYTFCEQNKPDPLSMFLTYSSPVLLGNKHFVVKEYKEEIHGKVHGSASNIGAQFTDVKVSKETEESEGKTETLKAFTPEQISVLCDHIISIFDFAKVYARSFPAYYRSYNKMYKQVSDIVMSYDDDRLRGVYIRHSYRNAMNLILDSMWKNCFGSDNKFLRYLMSVSKDTLKYCEQSLINETDSDSDD